MLSSDRQAAENDNSMKAFVMSPQLGWIESLAKVLPCQHRSKSNGTVDRWSGLRLELLERRCVLNAGSISGAVFSDLDNDAVLDETEVGIAGVEVTLMGRNDLRQRVKLTQLTAADGTYEFDGLRPGEYSIRGKQPQAFLDGDEQVGSGGGKVTNNRFSKIQLSDGDQLVGYNFGELLPARLTGYEFVDLDRDRSFESNDQALSGISVTLTGTDDRGNLVEQTGFTDVNGAYIFGDLRPGNYSIQSEQTPLYSDGPDYVGTFNPGSGPIAENGVAGQDEFTGIQLQAGNIGYNYNFCELDETFFGGILADTFDVTVEFTGTSAVDQFEFFAGVTEHRVVLNGVETLVSAAQNTLMVFFAGAEADNVVLHGSGMKEQVGIRSTSAKFIGNTFQLIVFSSPSITAYGGGGGDIAQFYDTAGDETFDVDPTSASIIGAGFQHQASGFHRVFAYAAAGGVDQAVLRGSAGDDKFKGTPTDARMEGAGFYNYARGFDLVEAYAGGGTRDIAQLYGSAGADTFEARSMDSRLLGSGFENRAFGFDRVYAYASGDSSLDRAVFFDSSGADYFKVDQYGARMYGAGYYNRAIGFGTNDAFFTTAGNDLDRAYLRDSSGDDSLVVHSDTINLMRAGAVYNIYGADKVRTVATIGEDTLQVIGTVDMVFEIEGDWIAV
jgi:hypothetical protein